MTEHESAERLREEDALRLEKKKEKAMLDKAFQKQKVLGRSHIILCQLYLSITSILISINIYCNQHIFFSGLC